MAQLPLARGRSQGNRKILVVDDVMVRSCLLKGQLFVARTSICPYEEAEPLGVTPQLNRRLLGKMVESLGFDPLYSADGAEAIDQFKQMRNAGDLFAILMASGPTSRLLICLCVLYV